MSATPVAPTFPDSALAADKLEKAWILNTAERARKAASHRECDALSEDGTMFAFRRFRYTKTGEKVLDKEVWVPLVEVPLTPEDAWQELSDLTFAVEEAVDDGEDPTVLRGVALQLATYGINFVTIAVEKNGRPARLRDIPDYAVGALTKYGVLNSARAATDDAYAALAKGHISISKVRKLEQEEDAAADEFLHSTLYALDCATDGAAGASMFNALAPALEALLARVEHAYG